MRADKLVKSIGIILGINLCTTIAAYAQVPAKVGIMGGVNIASIAGSDYDLDSKTGITAGLIITFDSPLLPVTFQPELLYSVKGFTEGNATIRLDYFEVPFLVKYKFLEESSATPSVLAGPYFAINTYSEAESSTLGTYDVTDVVEPFDFGLVLGGEVKISKIILGARYNAGLLQVFEGRTNIEGRNQALTLFAGLSF